MHISRFWSDEAMQISNKLQRVSEPLMGCINGTCKRWQDSVVVDHLPWTRSLRDNAQASPTYFNMIAPMRESHDTDNPLPCNAAGRLIKSIRSSSISCQAAWRRNSPTGREQMHGEGILQTKLSAGAKHRLRSRDF